jgi:hypothetical protein
MSALYLYHACPQIAMENMQGTASSKPLYKQLLCVNYFSYQCSESSHASEIEQVLLYLGQHLERAWSDLCGVQVYKTCVARNKRYVDAGISAERQLVFIDEASLPKERRGALKVTHYYMDRAQAQDRPAVGTIMLTNVLLDAAKTNRAVCVWQSEVNETDKLALARGCLLEEDVHQQRATAALPPETEVVLRGLQHAAEAANDLCGRDDICMDEDGNGSRRVYNLRDYVFLLRHLSRSMRGSGGGGVTSAMNAEFSAKMLLAAVERNYNGASRERFADVARRFLQETSLIGQLQVRCL